MDDRAISDLRQLSGRDAELSARTAELRSLDARVAAIRARAELVDAFFAAYPEEDTRCRAEARAAEEEVARRHGETEEAERALASARDDTEREHARHALERARDHVDVAVARLARAVAARDEHEAAASALTAELPALVAQARALAGEAAVGPPPGDGVGELVEWASHVHAELFVAAGHLDAQRERVIREANELASMLLGEPTYGSTVGQVMARVEAAAR